MNTDLRYSASSAANPLSGWGAKTALFGSSQTGTQYNGQSSHVVKVQGKTDGFLLMTDFWVFNPLYNSRQVWLPLSLASSTTCAAATPASWD